LGGCCKMESLMSRIFKREKIRIEKYVGLVEGQMSLLRSFANDENPKIIGGGIVLIITDKKGSYELVNQAKEDLQDYFEALDLADYPLTELKKEYSELVKKCEAYK